MAMLRHPRCPHCKKRCRFSHCDWVKIRGGKVVRWMLAPMLHRDCQYRVCPNCELVFEPSTGHWDFWESVT